MKNTRRLLSVLLLGLMLVLTPFLAAPRADAASTINACSIYLNHPYTVNGATALVSDFSIGCPGDVRFSYTARIYWDKTAEPDLPIASYSCSGCTIVSGGQYGNYSCYRSTYTRSYYSKLSVHDQYGYSRTLTSIKLVIAEACN